MTMQDHIKKDNVIFKVSISIITVFIVFAFFFNKALGNFASSALGLAVDYFGWFYLTSAFLVIVLLAWLCISPYGKIRLGKDTDRPTYKNMTWFAMLFTAGMAIGLVFFGLAEPIYHYVNPPYGEGNTAESATVAMKYSFLHWSLHPWAMYAIFGLALAYFQYRKNRPALISSTVIDLYKGKNEKVFKYTVEIFCIVATVFGVAASYGVGTLQMGAGLEHVFNIPNTMTTQFIIIGVISLIYITAAVSGIEKGIKFVSSLNIALAAFLLLFVFFFGPTLQIIQVFVSSLGAYMSDFVSMSLGIQPFKDNKWLGEYTVFYLAWWVSWAPAVGIFVARISRGRTIRGFIAGVLLAPSLLGMLWFSVFGGTGLHFLHDLGYQALADQVFANNALSMFAFLEYLPLTTFMSIITILLISLFFITNAEAVTFVLAMISQNGELHPSRKVKATWGIYMAVVTGLLLLTGDLSTIQTLAIITSFPLTILMLFMCYALIKELSKEEIPSRTIDKLPSLVEQKEGTTLGVSMEPQQIPITQNITSKK
ncbi:glycine/betaine ABC transporter permease [Sporosarcina sp. P12(2017)]|nr:glycine/betaine ABC transporter permease [Sporosarcina sp. P10]PIC61524.1 glycine/betaine ABC transporter permease [Sporosarcina sp. P12(2017)]